jgi:hypothetical protein
LVQGWISRDGGTTRQPYLFFCTQMNQNIYIGQSYTFDMYSPDDYLQTPFRTGRPAGAGELIETAQKKYIQGVFKSLGIDDVSGFVDPTAQDLSGFPLTDAARLTIFGDGTAAHPGISNEQAAMAQMSIWEMTHEIFDPAHPTASLDLHAGLVQWTWDGNIAFSNDTVAQFDQTVKGAENYVPEPGLIAFAISTTGMLAVRNRAPRARRSL